MSIQQSAAVEHGEDAIDELEHMRDAVLASEDVPDWFAEDLETTMDRLRWQTEQVEGFEDA